MCADYMRYLYWTWKTAAKNELQLRRIFYLHSYYSEDLIVASMSASSDIIITFKAFNRAFLVPRKIIPRYKKQSYIMKETQSRPYCEKKKNWFHLPRIVTFRWITENYLCMINK